MTLGTIFVFYSSLFFVGYSLIDYWQDRPMQHVLNAMVALFMAGLITYLDYRDIRKAREREDEL